MMPAVTAPPPDDKALEAAEKAIATARFVLGEKARYFKPLLVALEWGAVPGCKTAFATNDGFVGYEPSYITSLPIKQAAGVVAHELLHVWLEHHKRIGPRDPERWNQACDRALYGMIVGMGLEVPDGHLRGADLKMPEGLTADEYYREAEKQGNPPPKNPGKNVGSGGACGSAAGNPHPNEPPPKQRQQPRRTDAQINRARSSANEAASNMAASGQGTLPGSLAREVGEMMKPAKVDWRDAIGVAMRAAVSYRSGGLHQRYDAPSVRQAGIGYGDGKPILPRMRNPQPRVVVAVDTSGSMSGPVLTKVMVEVDGILKAANAAVDFVSCDAQVWGKGKVKTVEEAKKLLGGGGGTDFRPVFDAVQQMRPLPDTLVFLTDGMGPAPDDPPPGVNVVWAIVGEDMEPPVEWGTSVNIDVEDNNDQEA